MDRIAVVNAMGLMSPKTIAWGIVLVGVVSLSLHALVSRHAGSILSGWSFVAFAAALILGLLQPRADAKRFLPALCALVVSILHSLVVYGL